MRIKVELTDFTKPHDGVLKIQNFCSKWCGNELMAGLPVWRFHKYDKNPLAFALPVSQLDKRAPHFRLEFQCRKRWGAQFGRPNCSLPSAKNTITRLITNWAETKSSIFARRYLIPLVAPPSQSESKRKETNLLCVNFRGFRASCEKGAISSAKENNLV